MKLQINNLPHKNKFMAHIRLPLLLVPAAAATAKLFSRLPNSFLLYDKISPVILRLAKDLRPLAADPPGIIPSKTGTRLLCFTLLTA
jgi:hypothetical protein